MNRGKAPDGWAVSDIVRQVHDCPLRETKAVAASARGRLADIDRARGLAIILVVVGHLISDEFPANNDWYVALNLTIYKFHMAFFMFVTGFVMFYTYPEMHTLRDYAVYVKRRFVRLMPAYFLFALVMAAGKTLLGVFVPVENSMGGFSDIVKAIWCPGNSYCRNLWFIYAVFMLYVIVPPLLTLFKQRLDLLLVVALGAYFLPRFPYFGQSAVCQFAFVFLLGGWAARHRTAYTNLIDKYSAVFLAVFTGCILLYIVVEVPKLVFGLAAIPALHSLVRSRLSERIHVLALIGKYAFPIYLMNSLVIGGLLAILHASWSLDGAHFRMAAPVLFASGLLIPIVLYELLLKRAPVLRTIIRT